MAQELDIQAVWNGGGRQVAIAAGVLVVLTVASIAALWLAGFLFFALSWHNPLLAGAFGYIDALIDWSNGQLAGYGKRLVIAGVIGGLVPFLGPFVVVALLRAQAQTRELHGSARFANEAEIRKAGLL